jgi:hypothetical protein
VQRENGGKNTDALERRILKIAMTLRYYGEIGLFQLSSVHENNGYRRVSAGGKGCLFHSALYKKIYFYSTFCKKDLLNFFVSLQKNPGSFRQQKHQPIKRLVFLLVG